jgi:hypothetical protein
MPRKQRRSPYEPAVVVEIVRIDPDTPAPEHVALPEAHARGVEYIEKRLRGRDRRADYVEYLRTCWAGFQLRLRTLGHPMAERLDDDAGGPVESREG